MEGIMDGTYIRTALVIATCLNTALMATDVSGFNNPTVNMIYKIVSLVLNFVIVALATYYNNDYTPEAMVGTDITHKLKEDPTLVVECYDPDEDDDGDDEDETEPAEAEADETIEEGEADEVEQK